MCGIQQNQPNMPRGLLTDIWEEKYKSYRPVGNPHTDVNILRKRWMEYLARELEPIKNNVEGFL